MRSDDRHTFRHVFPIRGVILPAVLFAYALYCLFTQTAHLPGLGFIPGFIPLGISALPLKGLPASSMAVAWLGIGLALHALYFWGHVEPWWRYAPLGWLAGLALAFLGWGYVLVWLFLETFS